MRDTSWMNEHITTHSQGLGYVLTENIFMQNFIHIMKRSSHETPHVHNSCQFFKLLINEMSLVMFVSFDVSIDLFVYLLK